MRILLAEDDDQLRTSIARGLREASHSVDQAETGPKALALATTNQYDVIVLDLLLPGKRGIGVCRTLRERGHQVPILMLTALDSIDDRIAGLDAGADDYLTKPFDFGELLARIRALTRRRGEVLPSQLVIDDLVIDVARRTVHRGARDIPLTVKEFAFLSHLARHAGVVVTRADLMAHVWSDASVHYSNIIDVYAGRLRRKIDEGEDVALFATVRGTGFTLRAPERPKEPATKALRGTRRRG